MNKFWNWMISKGYCKETYKECHLQYYKYSLLDGDGVRVCPEKEFLIGYMIQYLMEETDTKNIEIVKDNFDIDSVYNLLVKAIEEKTK